MSGSIPSSSSVFRDASSRTLAETSIFPSPFFKTSSAGTDRTVVPACSSFEIHCLFTLSCVITRLLPILMLKLLIFFSRIIISTPQLSLLL